MAVRHRLCTVLITSALTATGALIASPAYAATCATGVQSDFNGDGFSDAVVGDPFGDFGGANNAGRVTVRYGNDARVGEGVTENIGQGLDAIGEAPEFGDQFGLTLASADLNVDGCTDLVVGAPEEDIGGANTAGIAQIVWGAPAGLGHGAASTDLTAAQLGGVVTNFERVGSSLDAVSGLGVDGAVVAIGAFGGTVDGLQGAGWATFVFGASGFDDPVRITQNTPGIPGAAEEGDQFGHAVALGLFSGTANQIDAAIGALAESVSIDPELNPVLDAGSLTIANDIAGGPNSGASITQNSPGVPGAVETGDLFGRELDAIRVGGTTRLAVGIPQEDVGSVNDAGSVQLFSSNGSTLTPGPAITQNTAGVGGVAETFDNFGNDVVIAPPGLGDTKTRLAVAVPREEGPAEDSGSIQIFPLDNLAADVSIAQNSPGVPGGVDANDRFGAALGFVGGAAERVWLVGVPFDADLATGMVNVIPVNGAAARFWAPGVDGIPAADALRFGAGLATTAT